MRGERHLTMVRLLIVGALVLPGASWAQERPPICDQIARTYDLDSWGQIDAIRYTFNVAFPGFTLARSWVWEPKTGRISFERKDKTGKLVKVTCLRSELNGQAADVKDQIDPAFFNDQYWLLLPLHLSWDTGAKVEDAGLHKLPLGTGSANRIVIKYPPSGGGCTPGDTWELFVGPDHRIQAFIYHRGVSQKPSVVVARWEDYKKAGPLLISMDHRWKAEGKPLRSFFTDVAVKLAGSDTWVETQ